MFDFSVGQKHLVLYNIANEILNQIIPDDVDINIYFEATNNSKELLKRLSIIIDLRFLLKNVENVSEKPQRKRISRYDQSTLINL